MVMLSAHSPFHRFLAGVVVALFASLFSVPAASPDYLKDIQPLLAERCYQCHGLEKQKGGLRLDVKSKALEGGDSGVAILPGKGADSLIIKLISGLDQEKIMDEAKSLGANAFIIKPFDEKKVIETIKETTGAA